MVDLEHRFEFFMPIQKALTGVKDGKRWIQGIASTAHEDLQGETVMQRGVDFSYFLQHGYINDDHGEWSDELQRKVKGPQHNVGEPTECEIRPEGFWLKGFLYKGLPRADHWWEFLNALDQSGATRRVGFSIEGRTKKREGGTIFKAWIKDVAITDSPVNTHTWAEVAKSLSAQRWCSHVGEGTSKSCPGCTRGCQGGGCGKGRSIVAPSSQQIQVGPDGLVSPGEAIRFLTRRGYDPAAARDLAADIFARHGGHR